MTAAYATVDSHSPLLSSSDSHYQQMRSLTLSAEMSQLPHDEVERRLCDQGRELVRLLLQSHMTLRGQDEPVDVVADSDGRKRTRRRQQRRTVATTVGKVVLERTGFASPGSSSLHPVDSSLNLSGDSYSLEVRRRVAELAANNSYDETVALIGSILGVSIPKRQAEELAIRAAQDFEQFYAETEPNIDPTEMSEFLVLSVDQKGIAMRHQDLRPQTRKAAEKKKKPKLDKRMTKGEKRSRKRYAAVASVYTIAPWVRSPEQVVAGLRGDSAVKLETPRPVPEFKRVWASIKGSLAEVIEQAFQEALSRDPKRSKHWVVLVDGDMRQLRLIKKAARRHQIDLTIVLDIIHVLEYLWTAAHVLHREGNPDAEKWVAKQLLSVLRGHSGRVAGAMRRSATMRKITGKPRQRLDRSADYLKKYRKYLNYGSYLENGLPIATGVIEGACRWLIGDRLGITGARWSLEGAEAILRLRALRGSGDWEDYWDFHRQCELRRNHLSKYRDGLLPRLAAATRHSHLRLVK